MAKTLKQFRLSDEAKQKLASLKKNLGKSEIDIVEEAIADLYAKSYNPHKLINDFYNTVSNLSEILENVRDYSENESDFTEVESEFLDLLNETFNKIRDLKGFWAPQYKENEHGDYIHDYNGELILDEEHQKTKPF